MKAILMISIGYYGVLLLALFIALGFYICVSIKEIKRTKELNQQKITQIKIELTLEQAVKIMELFDELTEEQIEEEIEEMTTEEKILLKEILEQTLELLKDESE